MTAAVKVAACSGQAMGEALVLLYRHLPEKLRAGQIEAAARALKPEELFTATVDGRVLGVLVAQCAAGRVGWLWPPVLEAALPAPLSGVQVAVPLIEAAVTSLAGAGSRMVQALLAPGSYQGRYLEAAGFAPITEMIRLTRRAGLGGVDPAGPPGLDFVAYNPGARGLLARLIRQTWEASRDCPELDGVRPAEEVLESYEASGAFRPDFWLLARRAAAEYVGCVLLAYHPEENRCELEYMGVIPAARGQGIGRALCTRAVVEAQRIGAHTLNLSVDARNEPAARLYKNLGFSQTDRRTVFIRRLAGAAAARGP